MTATGDDQSIGDGAGFGERVECEGVGQGRRRVGADRRDQAGLGATCHRLARENDDRRMNLGAFHFMVFGAITLRGRPSIFFTNSATEVIGFGITLGFW